MFYTTEEAAIVCGFFTVRELRELTRLQQKTEKTN